MYEYVYYGELIQELLNHYLKQLEWNIRPSGGWLQELRSLISP